MQNIITRIIEEQAKEEGKQQFTPGVSTGAHGTAGGLKNVD